MKKGEISFDFLKVEGRNNPFCKTPANQALLTG